MIGGRCVAPLAVGTCSSTAVEERTIATPDGHHVVVALCARHTAEVDRDGIAATNPILRRRVALGLGGRELARAAMVSHTYLLRLEAGGSDPTLAVLDRLAAALGVELGVLAEEWAAYRRSQTE